MHALQVMWDNHVYVPQRPGTRAIEELDRHRKCGFRVVFLNIGDADRDLNSIIAMMAYFRRWLSDHADRFILLHSFQDIERACQENKLAVGFNLEGLYPIGDRISILSTLQELGLRWTLLVYNRANNFGSGVHDDVDRGLTPLGYRAIAEMDRVGIIKCLSHTGHRTAMDVLNATALPCIFSHSNAAAVWNHARNIPDELIRTCAAGGGVVGINGLGLFLGENGCDPCLVADHIDHVVETAGIDHVGIGSDIGYTLPGEPASPPSDPAYWPPGHGYDADKSCFQTLEIERFTEVFINLEGRGYTASDLAKIKGQNMMRVAKAVWR